MARRKKKLPDNVVDMFSWEKQQDKVPVKKRTTDSDELFHEVIKRNLENIERQKKERSEKNKEVIRSERLLY